MHIGTNLIIFLPFVLIGKALSTTSETFVLTPAISEMLIYLVLMIFPGCKSNNAVQTLSFQNMNEHHLNAMEWFIYRYLFSNLDY